MANLEVGRRVKSVVNAITGIVEGVRPGEVFVSTRFGRSWQPDYNWQPHNVAYFDEIDEPITTVWGVVESSRRVPTKPLGGHGR